LCETLNWDVGGISRQEVESNEHSSISLGRSIRRT
jgi:hypothetical protein